MLNLSLRTTGSSTRRALLLIAAAAGAVLTACAAGAAGEQSVSAVQASALQTSAGTATDLCSEVDLEAAQEYAAEATLGASYPTTAGLMAVFEEEHSLVAAGTSQFRDLPDDKPVAFCIFDGQPTAVPRPPPVPGEPTVPAYTRFALVAVEGGEVIFYEAGQPRHLPFDVGPPPALEAR